MMLKELLMWLQTSKAEKSQFDHTEFVQYVWALAAIFENKLKRDLTQLQHDIAVELPVSDPKVQQVGVKIMDAIANGISESHCQDQHTFDSDLLTLCQAAQCQELNLNQQHKLLDNLIRLSCGSINHLLSFKVNLLLMNYTSSQGYLLQAAAGRDNHEFNSYCCPFRVALPRHVTSYLPNLNDSPVIRHPHIQRAVVSFKSLTNSIYLVPYSFTINFLHSYADLNDNFVRFSDGKGKNGVIGAFGYSDPGFYWWEHIPKNATYGERMSLGSYGIHREFLSMLHQELQGLDVNTMRTYQQYGGVSLEHVDRLLQVFSNQQVGLRLALDWTVDMINMVMHLIDCLEGQSSLPQEFLTFIKSKLSVGLIELQELMELISTESQTPQDNDALDKVWLIELGVWELMMLAASGMSLLELKQSLLVFDPDWQVNLYIANENHTVADHLLQEELCFTQGVVIRTLFASGTDAAYGVNRILKQLFVPVNELKVKINNNYFTAMAPQFQLDQSDEVHNHESEPELYNNKQIDKVQLWVNLADDLHGLLVDDYYSTVGVKLAKLLLEYVSGVRKMNNGVIFKRAVLVIDYTKFAANLPNQVVYSILLAVATELKSKTLIDDVLLLRTNFKYNTGVLDRYQSGEVLSFGHLSTQLNSDLLVSANHSFSAAEEEHNNWQLWGEYIPLMKRFYLLSDGISQRRFKDYARLTGTA